MSDNPWPSYHKWLDNLYDKAHAILLEENPQAKELNAEQFREYELRPDTKTEQWKAVTQDGVSIRITHGWHLVGWCAFGSYRYYIMSKRIKVKK